MAHMKSKISKVILGLLALSGMLAVAASGSAAQAATPSSSLTVSGFITLKSSLTNTQKSTIQKFVTANTGIATVSCEGYTGFNFTHISDAKIRNLAKARATNACQFAAKLASAAVGAITMKITKSQDDSIRRVVLRFTYAPPAGKYQYSMSNLDAGSVMHGGPLPGYFHEGDLVASTFADTAWSLDGGTAPEYGLMGTVGGGSAAYFGHWNTSADDTGTSYFLGDHLGPVAPGTTVTLYAIAATG
jgi:hypothetical protein